MYVIVHGQLNIVLKKIVEDLQFLSGPNWIDERYYYTKFSLDLRFKVRITKKNEKKTFDWNSIRKWNVSFVGIVQRKSFLIVCLSVCMWAREITEQFMVWTNGMQQQEQEQPFIFLFVNCNWNAESKNVYHEKTKE